MNSVKVHLTMEDYINGLINFGCRWIHVTFLKEGIQLSDLQLRTKGFLVKHTLITYKIISLNTKFYFVVLRTSPTVKINCWRNFSHFKITQIMMRVQEIKFFKFLLRSSIKWTCKSNMILRRFRSRYSFMSWILNGVLGRSTPCRSWHFRRMVLYSFTIFEYVDPSQTHWK